jgi:hypothetical protein
MAHSAAKQIADLQTDNDDQCGRPDRPGGVGARQPGTDGEDKREHEGRREDEHLEASCKDDPDRQADECGEKHFTTTSPGAASALFVNAQFLIAAQQKLRLPRNDPLFPGQNSIRPVT